MRGYLLSVALMLLVVFPQSIFAQIPNSGFELWGSCDPNDWATSNGGCVVSPLPNVTMSNSAHGGSSAARGEVVFVVASNIEPVLQSGPTGEGFPISQRYAEMQGFYKFSPVGGDRFSVNVAFFKNGGVVAQGAIADSTTHSTYTQFNVTMNYFSSDVPDTAIISILVVGPLTGGDFHLGSVMFVDDLSFSGVVAVDENNIERPLVFNLSQNYPNPFNPTTTIKFSVEKLEHATVKVYSMLGQEVAQLFDGMAEPGHYYRFNFNSSHLGSGLYIYRIVTDSHVAVKKMLMIK